MKTLRWALVIAHFVHASTVLAAPFAYVASFASIDAEGTRSLLVLDLATNTVTATVPLRFLVGPMAVDPTGARVYTATPNRLRVLDTATNTITGEVPYGIYAGQLAVNPTGTRVFALPVGAPTTEMYAIDTASNAVVGTVPVSGYFSRVVASNTAVYVLGASLNGDSALEVVADDCLAVRQRIDLPPNAVDLTVNPDGTRLYVSHHDPGRVSVIDTASHSVIATVSVGGAPTVATVNAAGTRLYVVNSMTRDLAVIDTAANAVVAVVPVGFGPIDVAIHPDGTRVYVTNQGSNSVSVIDTAANELIDTLPVALPGEIEIASGIAPPPPPPPGPLANVEVTHVEVTQAIQDLNNRVPLIAGRRTFVRVHVESPTPVANVSARLNVANTSCQVGECTTRFLGSLAPTNPGGPILTTGPTPTRSSLNDSFLFELPWA